jgi:hypothetical protein
VLVTTLNVQKFKAFTLISPNLKDNLGKLYGHKRYSKGGNMLGVIFAVLVFGVFICAVLFALGGILVTLRKVFEWIG